MPPIDPALFQILVGLCGALAGWILRVIWQDIKELHAQDRRASDRMGKLEILVAGEYVKRTELEKWMKDVSHDLRRIYDKIDRVIVSEADR